MLPRCGWRVFRRLISAALGQALNLGIEVWVKEQRCAVPLLAKIVYNSMQGRTEDAIRPPGKYTYYSMQRVFTDTRSFVLTMSNHTCS